MEKNQIKNGSYLTHFNKSKSLNNNPSFVSVNRHKKSYIMFMHALPVKRKNGGKTDSPSTWDNLHVNSVILGTT